MRENSNPKPAYSIGENIVYIINLLWAGHKGILALMATVTLCTSAMPFAGMFLTKIVVDLLVAKASTQHILVTLGGMTVGIAALYFTRGYCERYNYFGINRIRQFLMWEIFNKSLRCDYMTLESEHGQTTYQKSFRSLDIGDQSGTTRIISAMMQIAASGTVFLLTSSILSAFDPMFVLVLIAMSLIQYTAARYATRYERNAKDKDASLGRRLWYIITQSNDPVGGKDIRLYGVSGWFISSWVSLMKEMLILMKRVRSRYMVSNLVSALLNMVRDGACLLFIIRQVSAGSISLGDAVLFFGAVMGFSGFIGEIVSGINALQSSSLMMCDTRSFLDIHDEPDPVDPAEPPSPSEAVSIEFRDVCFRYGDNEENTIDHLSLTINAGERIALVGRNGAGKTTLIKLLCGFYRPDAGSILINGTDIARFRKRDLLKLFSAVFQDVFILPFTIAENVAMQTSDRIDRERVTACLDMAGLGDTVRGYPLGMDAVMTKLSGEDGVMMSGGQQQRLLLARALYKNAPILVLDEPTAALDPIAESELYGRYGHLTAGKTSIYISHRLASTRFCDRIAFLSGGTVSELGSHHELMARCGEYAHMFGVQSHYYQDRPDERGVSLHDR